MITVRHSAFKDFALNLPINWSIDPYKNKNWLHHFNSLRWLLGVKLDVVEKVISDFYSYHCVKKKRNPYYNQLRGDHAAAIRLEVFLDIFDKLEKSNLQNSSNICTKLIKEEIKNLSSSNMYRAGHNHGLMADISLLELIKKKPALSSEINIDWILQRSGETIDAMWHFSGLTKEHSISYQEYNLELSTKYFLLLQDLNLIPHTKVSIEKILSESKQLLGCALRENGEYFPLGDSFRTPNIRILRKIFDSNNAQSIKEAKELLAPHSNSSNFCYANDHFFIAKKELEKNKIHFAITSCWDSINHKKNDELSFCLDIDGLSVFDAPGFSAFSSQSVNDWLSTEYANSTIFFPGTMYSEKKGVRDPTGSKIASYDKENFSCLAVHSRLPDVEVRRLIEISNDQIKLRDEISANEKSATQQWVVSRFILSKSAQATVINHSLVKIEFGGDCFLEMRAISEIDGFFKLGCSKIIASDKTKVLDVTSIDYIRFGFKSVDFLLSIKQKEVGVKSVSQRYINALDYLKPIPSIQALWEEAQEYVHLKDAKMIKCYQNAIYALHNSFISPEMKLGHNVKFGYGGIGVVLHKNCILGDGVTIAQNVTVGGSPGSSGITENNEKFFVPILKNDVYVAAGSKIIGAVIIGEYSVIGANSVVVKNVEPFSVYGGNPARKIKSITQENCLKYKSFFHRLAHLPQEEYINTFPEN